MEIKMRYLMIVLIAAALLIGELIGTVVAKIAYHPIGLN